MGSTAKSYHCKNCDAPLDLKGMMGGVVTCKYCGEQWTFPNRESPAANEIMLGEHYLDVADFDRARACFRKAAELAPKEPEAYFGLARAELRVQFIRDLSTGEPRIRPICHEISAANFTENANYLKAVSLATDEQKAIYRARGREIDHIREEFYNLRKQRLDYDVFLCTKVSGGSTQESHETLKLYEALKKEGIRPFYSEVDAKGRTGEDYEALILYALMQSESMIVVCFHEGYLDTPWVKNEYTRFMEFVKGGKKELGALTILYQEKNGRIEHLPGFEGVVEGIDLDRPDAYTRAINHVKKFAEGKRRRHSAEAEQIRKEAELLAEENEANRLKLEAEKEKTRQEEDRRRHELELQRQEERRKERERKEAERKEKHEERAAARKERLESLGEGLSEFFGGVGDFFSNFGEHFSGIGEWAQKKSIPFCVVMLILAVIEVAGATFAVSYPFAVHIVGGSPELTAYIVVLSLFAVFLILHLTIYLIAYRLHGLAFFGAAMGLVGLVAMICILIGWFCNSMGAWLWVFFAFGLIAAFFSSVINEVINEEVFYEDEDFTIGAAFTVTAAIVFAVFCSLCGILFSVQNAEDGYEEGFYYDVLEDGTAEVYVYEYNTDEIVFPAEIGGRLVTKIGAPVRTGGKVLKSVTVPDGVLVIEHDAFRDCVALSEVSLSLTVTKLEARVFMNCSRLKEAVLTESITEFGSECFRNCTSIEAVTIPDSVTRIGANAFKGCVRLKSITLPASTMWRGDGYWTTRLITLDSTMDYILECFMEDGQNFTKEQVSS